MSYFEFVNNVLCCTGPASEEEEGMSPMAHVMDDSGALSAGPRDPGVPLGVVEMPDSESLRRSVAAANAAEHERQAASSNGSQPAFQGDRGPVSATSSGSNPAWRSQHPACVSKAVGCDGPRQLELKQQIESGTWHLLMLFTKDMLFA